MNSLLATLGAGLVLVLLLAMPAAALESEECLGCHGDADSVEAGQLLDAAAFAATPHADLGCMGCHTAVGDGHPDDGIRPSQAACGECHGEVAAAYAASVHGGNAACGDCHDPHAVRALDEVSGEEMNRPCAGCHESAAMLAKHGQWLPQTALHLGALSCISCHTDSEKLDLNLYLVLADGGNDAGSNVALPAREELVRLAGGREPGALVDRDGDGKVSLAELRSFNRQTGRYGLRLHGMLVPARPSHEYGILYNRWDCSFCHGTGPGALAASSLNLPTANGSFSRLPVEQGAVLATLYSTPDFYLVGGTRNAALNVAGAMILAGGLVMPLGHGLLRFLTRRNRQHQGEASHE